jgi:integrase
LADGNLRAILPHVEHEAKQLGFTFDTNAPGAVDALRLCLTAWRQARADVVRRDAGDVVETPKAPQTAPAVTVRREASGSPRTLRDVFPLWDASKTRRPDTVRAATRALNLFEEATGNPDIQQITRAQGADFRAWLRAQPTSDKTACDRFDYVKGLLNYAARDLDLIPKNPWTGLRIEYATEKPGRPWSDEEIRALCALPLFTRFELPKAKMAGKQAAYWVPILGLFTGARISELVQLSLTDFDTVDGVPLLRIVPEPEGQTLKSQAARRLMPLHSQVIQLGFLDYVQSIKDAGQARLFPDVPWREEKPGGLFSAWFAALKGKVNRDRPLPRFHDFRHTVRTKLTEALVAEPTIDALVGHAISGSTGAKVYTHRSPRALKTAIDKLAYPGLVLPRVFPAPSSRPSGSQADTATA